MKVVSGRRSCGKYKRQGENNKWWRKMFAFMFDKKFIPFIGCTLSLFHYFQLFFLASRISHMSGIFDQRVK
jgi:hypothetical protein